MPITTDDDGTITIDADMIPITQIHARIGALALSIRGGGRPGLMDTMGAQCGSAKRTKKGVLEDYVLWFHTIGGTLGAQWMTVERALGADRKAKLRRKCDKAEIAWADAKDAKEAKA